MGDDQHEDGLLARRTRHLETLLEESGTIGGTDVDDFLDEYLESASPALGAKLVARAWLDGRFRQLLLHDVVGALRELGVFDASRPTHQRLEQRRVQVVENTAKVHNIIVCTLCSCYPTDLLGPSPGWYKSDAYRARVVHQPREALTEFGLTLPEEVHIRVWDASAEWRYMVLPRRPSSTEGLSELQLRPLVTRAGLIGTAAV